MSYSIRKVKYLFPWWSYRVSPGLDLLLLLLGGHLVTLLGIVLVGAREHVPLGGHLLTLPGILLVVAGQHFISFTTFSGGFLMVIPKLEFPLMGLHSYRCRL